MLRLLKLHAHTQLDSRLGRPMLVLVLLLLLLLLLLTR
jgi:hypothetical protein